MARIRRVPIKIRKPIFLETCKCWDIKTFSVEGKDRMITGYKMTFEKLDEFIHKTEMMLPVLLKDDEEDKAHLCLDNGIPISLILTKLPRQEILDKMYSVPHCSMYVTTELQHNDSVFSTLEKSKANSVLLALLLEYVPGKDHILDMYQYIDIYKNFVSHVMIRIPDIDGDIGVYEDVKKAYMPDVPSRKWVPKPQVKEAYIEKMKEYVKPRKLTLEYIYPMNEDNNLRQIKELSKEPFGMKGFYYMKNDNEFEVSEESEGFNCSTCGKPIFR